MTKFDYKSAEEVKARIAEIEQLWIEDLAKEHGGGLSSSINMELIQLRNMLTNMSK